jgi:hypothetical protein
MFSVRRPIPQAGEELDLCSPGRIPETAHEGQISIIYVWIIDRTCVHLPATTSHLQATESITADRSTGKELQEQEQSSKYRQLPS